MSGSEMIWATALYRPDAPGELVIIYKGTGSVEGVPVALAASKPTTRALVSTPWTAPPGATWQETEPGIWRITVYRHPGS